MGNELTISQALYKALMTPRKRTTKRSGSACLMNQEATRSPTAARTVTIVNQSLRAHYLYVSISITEKSLEIRKNILAFRHTKDQATQEFQSSTYPKCQQEAYAQDYASNLARHNIEAAEYKQRPYEGGSKISSR